MPKFQDFSSRVSQVGGSVFERYAGKMAAQGDNLVKLHIGDTYLAPGYDLPLSRSLAESQQDLYQYCNTFGIAPLREALVEKLQHDNQLKVEKDNILLTNGATNALSISMSGLIESDDEVIILTPIWPFFFGMVKIAGGKIIEVPFYTVMFENPELDIRAYLQPYVTAKTAAIYINSPNNPSGKVLNRSQLDQLAEFAQHNNLWVISDEAYDGLTFDDHEHLSIASLPGMFERTISIFTFSKSFMFAGLRLGYMAASIEAVQNLNKMMVHQVYSPSTLAQVMMVEPVKTRGQWLPAIQRQYQDLRDLVVADLKVDFSKPEGTYFVFFPVEKYLNGRGYWQLIEDCLDNGVAVAPGDSFGSDYGKYIRLCFTGESPEKLRVGLQRLNAIFN